MPQLHRAIYTRCASDQSSVLSDERISRIHTHLVTPNREMFVVRAGSSPVAVRPHFAVGYELWLWGDDTLLVTKAMRA